MPKKEKKLRGKAKRLAEKKAAKAAAKAAEEAAKAKDHVGLLHAMDDGQPRWLTEGSSVLDKDVILPNIRITTPDGRTELISGCRFSLVYGRRYGLFGRNGIGKSTLLNAISSYSLPGQNDYLRIMHIHQESDVAGDDTPINFILKSDVQKKYLIDREEKLLAMLEDDENSELEQKDLDELQSQLDRVYERLEDIGADRAEGKVHKILEGLQFTKEMMNAPTKSLSGGWRMRVALATALFVEPDILLLDEPTNHLDFPAVVWLEKYLKTYENTLVVVSHDRLFLDNIITDVIDFRDQALHYYKGDYTSYEKVRKQEQANLRKEYDAQQKRIANLEEFVRENSFKNNEKTASACKQKKALLAKEKANELPEPVDEKPIKIKFPEPTKLDHKLIEILDMEFSWDGKTEDPDDPNWRPLLKDVNLAFDMGERVGVLGANGAGKTTLVKLVMGKIQPTKGRCRLNPEAKVALFTQHHVDQLDVTMTPFDYLQSKFPLAHEGRVRGFLCSFGLNIKAVTEQKIGTLSGGQKSRVAFAVLNWENPHFIIMDEPTNHLDLETIDSLLAALEGYQGGILVISHDQYFLSKVAETFWAVDSRGTVSVIHDLDEAKKYSYKYNVRTADVAKTKKQLKREKEEAEARRKRIEAGEEEGEDDESKQE